MINDCSKGRRCPPSLRRTLTMCSRWPSGWASTRRRSRRWRRSTRPWRARRTRTRSRSGWGAISTHFLVLIVHNLLLYTHFQTNDDVQRLRGEARLLRQRMDALEAECGSLADSLLQGQVLFKEEVDDEGVKEDHGNDHMFSSRWWWGWRMSWSNSMLT